MAYFMTRVELHDANAQDYDQLHAAMEDKGFSRLIETREGQWFQLPPAQYHLSSSLSLEQVLESAKKAVATTRKRYGICVTEAVSSILEGLAIVPQA